MLKKNKYNGVKILGCRKLYLSVHYPYIYILHIIVIGKGELTQTYFAIVKEILNRKEYFSYKNL